MQLYSNTVIHCIVMPNCNCNQIINENVLPCCRLYWIVFRLEEINFLCIFFQFSWFSRPLLTINRFGALLLINTKNNHRLLIILRKMSAIVELVLILS